MSLRLGPTPWTCPDCNTTNEMFRSDCKECGREPRTTLSDGTQIYSEHRRLKENGQQEGYVVLAEEERAKGFVRPVRQSYLHLECGTITTMGQTIAETYARNPSFYSGTFCCGCGKHFPVSEFVWDGSNERVGT
jgi:hypothetical protein